VVRLTAPFAPITAASQNVINRSTGGNVQVLATTIGNIDLKPEAADTWQIGAVYQPEFLPGFSVSFDYYNISLDGAISTLTIQQIVDLCFQGNTEYCAFVDLDGTFGSATNPTSVIQKPFNFATVQARGFDIEASYQIPLGSLGDLTLRGVASHAIDMLNDTGIAGQQIAQLAGNNNSEFGAIAKWKGMLTQQFDAENWRFTLTERFVSSGAIDPNAITCTANCPAPTVQNPTYNFNHIPGAIYVDVGGSYNLTEEAEVYFKVDNLFNHRAPPFGASSLYDVVGRMFRLGARFEF
jgi:outer membrane receptor protein involved in Fe transport